MIVGITKFAVTVLVNGYVFGPLCADACNGLFKTNNVSERTEILTRGALAICGISASAAVADVLVDAVVKKGAEEAVKGFIRAIV